MLLPYTSGSINGGIALLIDSKNSSYNPLFINSKIYLNSICMKTDSLSSHPGVNVLALPISNETASKDSDVLYIFNFLS